MFRTKCCVICGKEIEDINTILTVSGHLAYDQSNIKHILKYMEYEKDKNYILEYMIAPFDASGNLFIFCSHCHKGSSGRDYKNCDEKFHRITERNVIYGKPLGYYDRLSEKYELVRYN